MACKTQKDDSAIIDETVQKIGAEYHSMQDGNVLMRFKKNLGNTGQVYAIIDGRYHCITSLSVCDFQRPLSEVAGKEWFLRMYENNVRK